MQADLENFHSKQYIGRVASGPMPRYMFPIVALALRLYQFGLLHVVEELVVV